MLKRLAMLAAGLLLCMPIGGGLAKVAHCFCSPQFNPHAPVATGLFGPVQIAILGACAAVLSLTASHRWD